MKLTAFMRAIKFACLPTLSLLVLLFFGFFSISKTIEFISSDHTLAIIVRVIAVIAEIILVWLMYEKYLEEEILKSNHSDIKNSGYKIDKYKSIYQLVNNWNSNDKYELFDTPDGNIKIIKRIPNNTL